MNYSILSLLVIVNMCSFSSEVSPTKKSSHNDPDGSCVIDVDSGSVRRPIPSEQRVGDNNKRISEHRSVLDAKQLMSLACLTAWGLG